MDGSGRDLSRDLSSIPGGTAVGTPIIELSITTEWQAVAFLERDLTEVRERQCEAAALAGRSGDEPIDGQTPPTSSPPSAPP